MSNKINKEIDDMSEKLKNDQLEDVAGGGILMPPSDPAGNCFNYICKTCGGGKNNHVRGCTTAAIYASCAQCKYWSGGKCGRTSFQPNFL